MLSLIRCLVWASKSDMWTIVERGYDNYFIIITLNLLHVIANKYRKWSKMEVTHFTWPEYCKHGNTQRKENTSLKQVLHSLWVYFFSSFAAASAFSLRWGLGERPSSATKSSLVASTVYHAGNTCSKPTHKYLLKVNNCRRIDTKFTTKK